ncbi:MAG TPA: DUF2817 domain-containing protein [Terriglobia bacterium]|nr:DUF2817 domain-containing protein [Terriglobia bacterium]
MTAGGRIRYFSADYLEARERFRDLSARAGARLDVLELSARGPSGEDLSIDIASVGPPAARRILLHSSGMHGVEGFAGSAVQLQLLDDLPSTAADTAIVLTHILNPWGMAWLRRVNENNVDLNRNFFPEGGYSGAPDIYASADALLNPKSPPSHDFFFLKALALVARYGMASAKQAVAGGQYEFPKGLFFGGRRLEEGPEKYLRFLQDRLASAAVIHAIDTHTGLGRRGQAPTLAAPGDYERARRIFGDSVPPADPDRNPSYLTRGGLGSAIARSLPQADTLFVTQEFGTCHPIRAVQALREENRWFHYGAGALDHPARRALMETFAPDDDRWREGVLQAGRALVDRAWRSLSDG